MLPNLDLFDSFLKVRMSFGDGGHSLQYFANIAILRTIVDSPHWGRARRNSV